MKTKIYIVPVKDIYHVNLTFPMEDFRHAYAAGPTAYLAQLIGYKGPRGLFSQLRSQGHDAMPVKLPQKNFLFQVQSFNSAKGFRSRFSRRIWHG
jgi:hypothetical protein